MRKLVTLAMVRAVVIGLTGLVTLWAHGPPGYGPSGVYVTPADYQPISITMATPSAIPALDSVSIYMGYMPAESADAWFSRATQKEVAPIAQTGARAAADPSCAAGWFICQVT